MSGTDVIGVRIVPFGKMGLSFDVTEALFSPNFPEGECPLRRVITSGAGIIFFGSDVVVVLDIVD